MKLSLQISISTSILGNNILDSVELKEYPNIFTPCRLVSLLDMNVFPLTKLLTVLDALTRTTIIIEERNYELNETIPNDAKTTIKTFLKTLEVACKTAGLESPLHQIVRLQKIINQPVSKSRDFIIEYKDFRKRLDDELSTPMFMVLPKKMLHFYGKIDLFGGNVFSNFVSANFDIEECGKCFATGRYTACVMHLQRVLEIGLKSYGRCLGIMVLINTPEPSWNLVLDKTRKEIKERNDRNVTANIWKSNAEKEFCEGVQPFLEAVKTAWRNPSMHADKIYGQEIAEDIFSAVKRFMKHLAEHLDESGTFTP